MAYALLPAREDRCQHFIMLIAVGKHNEVSYYPVRRSRVVCTHVV